MSHLQGWSIGAAGRHRSHNLRRQNGWEIPRSQSRHRIHIREDRENRDTCGGLVGIVLKRTVLKRAVKSCVDGDVG